MGKIVTGNSDICKSVSGSVRVVNKNPGTALQLTVCGDEIVITGDYFITDKSNVIESSGLSVEPMLDPNFVPTEAPVDQVVIEDPVEVELAAIQKRVAPKAAITKPAHKLKSKDSGYRQRVAAQMAADKVKGRSNKKEREVRPKSASQVLNRRSFADPSTGTNVEGANPRPMGVEGLV